MRAVAGRISWGLADQAVSSMTNFAVGIYVARTLGVTEFGVFTLAWVTYGLVLNISRGLTTDPLVVRFSGVSPAAWRAAVARSSGTALLIGLVSGVVSVLAGLAIGGGLGAAFVALGLVFPMLLLQDSWRFAFFAAGQGRKAFVNDVVWGAALIPALVLAAQQGSVFWFVLAWGVSGGVAAGFGYLQSGVVPAGVQAAVWLRQQRDLGPRYLVENVSNSGASQLRMYGLGAIAGLSEVGAIRGAELLLGPFLAVLMGLSLVAVPEAARVLRRSPHRLPKFCLVLGGSQAAAALVWGCALLLVPDIAGEFVLDSVWEPASALILPVTLSVTGAGLVAGAASGLRALGAARRSLRSQLIASAGYLGGGLAGATIAGALGASWGSAIAMWCGAAIWWGQLRVAHREHQAGIHATSDESLEETEEFTR
ncbi:hypothetical protein [Amycolatopsis marina]|nr:hypothetical protein [Amycolatopsis marina]